MVIGMNFGGVLLAVKDMTKAKQFYVEVMEQKIEMDLDNVHVAFESLSSHLSKSSTSKYS